jgi:hypothetical protein
LFFRAAAVALCVTVGFGLAAAPCVAADTAKTTGSLTRLSPASRQVLAKVQAPARSQTGQPTPASAGSGGSFFKSTKGKVTLALMGAGVGFTVWSINHDRKPVKSPIR